MEEPAAESRRYVRHGGNCLPPDRRLRRADLALGEDVLDVLRHRAAADREGVGDLLVGRAADDVAEDRPLLTGERRDGGPVGGRPLERACVAALGPSPRGTPRRVVRLRRRMRSAM